MTDQQTLTGEIYFLARTVRGLLREASQAASMEDAQVIITEADECLGSIFEALKQADQGKDQDQLRS
jgi:hypothetical protein